MDNLLSSDDIHYMLGALRTLGLHVEEDKANQRAVVGGSGGLFPASKEAKDEIQLFLGNAGTAMRPLTAAVVAAGGNARYTISFLVIISLGIRIYTIFTGRSCTFMPDS